MKHTLLLVLAGCGVLCAAGIAGSHARATSTAAVVAGGGGLLSRASAPVALVVMPGGARTLVPCVAVVACDPKACDPKACDPKACDPKACDPKQKPSVVHVVRDGQGTIVAGSVGAGSGVTIRSGQDSTAAKGTGSAAGASSGTVRVRSSGMGTGGGIARSSFVVAQSSAPAGARLTTVDEVDLGRLVKDARGSNPRGTVRAVAPGAQECEETRAMDPDCGSGSIVRGDLEMILENDLDSTLEHDLDMTVDLDLGDVQVELAGVELEMEDLADYLAAEEGVRAVRVGQAHARARAEAEAARAQAERARTEAVRVYAGTLAKAESNRGSGDHAAYSGSLAQARAQMKEAQERALAEMRTHQEAQRQIERTQSGQRGGLYFNVQSPDGSALEPRVEALEELARERGYRLRSGSSLESRVEELERFMHSGTKSESRAPRAERVFEVPRTDEQRRKAEAEEAEKSRSPLFTAPRAPSAPQGTLNGPLPPRTPAPPAPVRMWTSPGLTTRTPAPAPDDATRHDLERAMKELRSEADRLRKEMSKLRAEIERLPRNGAR